MKLTALFSFLWVFTAQAQFPEKHLEALAKLNCGLSDTWTIDLMIEDEFNSRLPYPAIAVDCTNYKTEHDGVNFLPTIHLFEKKYAAEVRAYDWEDGGDVDAALMETGSYIVVIDFPLLDEEYNALTAILLNELKAYFAENYARL